MAEAIFTIPVTGTIDVENNLLTIRIRECVVTVNLEESEIKPGKRLELGRGKTMFDLVLEAAKASVVDTGEREFSAAELYHLATRRYPELKLKKSSWVSHVIASAPNHSSYHHYSSHRRFFRHLGKGRYTLDPSLPVEDK